MALFIKNAEVEHLAHELSNCRRISVTEAIRQSLARELARERRVMRDAGSTRLNELMQIAERAARIPRVSPLTDDEILGYDEPSSR